MLGFRSLRTSKSYRNSLSQKIMTCFAITAEIRGEGSWRMTGNPFLIW
jgi:hypothetical protein